MRGAGALAAVAAWACACTAEIGTRTGAVDARGGGTPDSPVATIADAPAGSADAPVAGGADAPPLGPGPLRVDTTNPRYFSDGQKIVYLTGSHTWGNFRDRSLTDPPPPFDYAAFLDFLVAHHHNFFRLWTWEQPHSWDNNTDGLARYYVP